MDTSEQYIEMADCEEIQGHTPNIGDYYWEKHIDGQETVWTVYDTGFNDYEKLDWGTVFLPKQDQLQEMLDYSLFTLLEEFDRWRRNSKPVHTDVRLQLNLSMEQLWLAFVMEQLHGKKWSGTEWVAFC